MSSEVTNPIAARLRQIHLLQNEVTSSAASGDLIELVYAVAISLRFSDRDYTAPVWLMIAGSPSSGKTDTVLGLNGHPKVVYLDTLTENAFVSGYVDPRTGVSTQSDLLPKLDGKCLVVKDLTTIFSLRPEKVKKLLGDLSAIFDGTYAKATGTRGRIEYSSRFALLGCITNSALKEHHRYMSLIGGRFLIYRVPTLSDEARHRGFELVWEGRNRRGRIEALRDQIREHLTDLWSQPLEAPEESAEQQKAIDRLATLITLGRSVVHYYQDPRPTDDIEDIQTEEPWRVHQQLRTLGRALARVHGRPKLTAHELELLRRVALSSMPSDRVEIFSLFPKHPEGLTPEICADEIGRSEKQASRRLRELEAIKLVTRDHGTFRPVPDLAELLSVPVLPLDHVKDLEEPQRQKLTADKGFLKEILKGAGGKFLSQA